MVTCHRAQGGNRIASGEVQAATGTVLAPTRMICPRGAGMETSSSDAAALAQAIGRRILSATSSLGYFAVTLDGGLGLLAEARPGGEAPTVSVAAVPAGALPTLGDAVCAVDWSWIVGATIRGGTLADGRLRLDLDPAGPLAVSAATWQDSPFLAFQPYKAPQ